MIAYGLKMSHFPTYPFYKKTGHNKLLITLGDSWTHGVGSYEPELLSQFMKNELGSKEMYGMSNDRFYETGWPSVLSDRLKCDLINYGTGGDSNSACVKRLINEYDEDYKKDYDHVTVIWLLTNTVRFSFYSDNQLKSFSPAGNHTDPIFKKYIKDVVKSDNDAYLETAFYLKTMQYYCKAKGYNFIYGSAWEGILPLNEVVNLDSNIHNFVQQGGVTSLACVLEDGDRSHCLHPNEQGYKRIADYLYTVISENMKVWI